MRAVHIEKKSDRLTVTHNVEMPISGSLCGMIVTHYELGLNDIRFLLETYEKDEGPKKIRDMLEGMLMRFEPVKE